MTRQSRTLSSIFGKPAFSWLDRLARPLQHGVHATFRSGPIGMRAKSWLNGTPLRHRIHPALVVVPLGAWTTAAFLDVLDSTAGSRKGQGYRASADAALALGILGSLPAVATGLADWADTHGQQRRVGMGHALCNNVALVCYATSFALRLSGKDRRGSARFLSGVGFGMVTLASSLGGELVYTLGVNVSDALPPEAPNKFVDVLNSDELVEGTPVAVDVEQARVLLVRRGNQIHAVQERCPHAGGPLSQGTFEDGVVECPWHQSRFCLIDGRPTQGPAAIPLRTFEVREQAGRIAVGPSADG